MGQALALPIDREPSPNVLQAQTPAPTLQASQPDDIDFDPENAVLEEDDFDPTNAVLEEEDRTTVEGVASAAARGASPYAMGAVAGAIAGAPFGGVGAGPGAAAGVTAVGVLDLASVIYNPIAEHYDLPKMISPTEAANNLLDWAGVDRPKTATERFVQSGVGGAVGAISLAKSVGTLSQLIDNPSVRATMLAMSRDPWLQAVAGGMGGSAAQVAAEANMGPLVQIIAAVGGSMVPFAVRGALTPSPQATIPLTRAASLERVPPKAPIAEGGAKPSGLKQAEDVLEDVPKQAKEAFDELESELTAEVTSTVHPRITPQATAAHEAGFVVPPSLAMQRQSIPWRLAELWGGDRETRYLASTINHGRTEELIREAFGIHADDALNETTFSNLRNMANEAYHSITESGAVITADDAYRGAIAGLGQRQGIANPLLPNWTNNRPVDQLVQDLGHVKSFTPAEGIEVVTELRRNARDNLMARGDPDRLALGMAQRRAADAIEALMDRELSRVLSPQAMEQYRNARDLIAQTYDVQSVIDPITGEVDAQGLARLAQEGRQLATQLYQIARMAIDFPDVMQRPSTFRDLVSERAAANIRRGASLVSLLMGHPLIALGIWGRPFVRRLLLSQNFQKAMMSQELFGEAPPSVAAEGALDQMPVEQRPSVPPDQPLNFPTPLPQPPRPAGPRIGGAVGAIGQIPANQEAQ